MVAEKRQLLSCIMRLRQRVRRLRQILRRLMQSRKWVAQPDAVAHAEDCFGKLVNRLMHKRFGAACAQQSHDFLMEDYRVDLLRKCRV